ncbi:13081_t:CDS:2, partial [Funneliformis geosporum]
MSLITCHRRHPQLVGDFGFCRSADKPLESIYKNHSYIAPEVINGKGYTFASDIYSIAINLIKGMRPQIIQGTPTEYKNLMVRCWDADSLKRYGIDILGDKIG